MKKTIEEAIAEIQNSLEKEMAKLDLDGSDSEVDKHSSLKEISKELDKASYSYLKYEKDNNKILI